MNEFILEPTIARFTVLPERANAQILAFADLQYGEITICNIRIERDPVGNPTVIFPTRYNKKTAQPVQFFAFANSGVHRRFAGLVLTEYQRRTAGGARV